MIFYYNARLYKLISFLFIKLELDLFCILNLKKMTVLYLIRCDGIMLKFLLSCYYTIFSCPVNLKGYFSGGQLDSFI